MVKLRMPTIDDIANPEIIPPAKHMLDATYNALIGPWMQNLAINLPKIRKGLNLLDLPKKEGEPAIVVGAGPSLAKYKHLEMIKKAGWKHPVLSCDRILSNCLKVGIKPYIVASVDGSPMIADYYEDKIVRKASKNLNAVFSITVHPKTVKAWKGKIWWFTPMFDVPEDIDKKLNKHSISYILYLLSGGKGLISAIGNVGAFCFNLAAELGSSPIIFVGMDYSEQVRDKADAVYFMRYAMMFMKKGGLNEKEAQDKAALLHQVETNPDFGTRYLVNPIWKSYRDQLKLHIITSEVHTINSTGGGCLHTKAIKASNFEALSLEEVLRRYN